MVLNESTAGPQFESLLTINEAAGATGIAYWLLKRAVSRGELPSYKIGNSRRRVRISDIHALLEGQR